jgi:hypothetical protein
MTNDEVIPEGCERLAPGVAPGVQDGKSRSTPAGLQPANGSNLGGRLNYRGRLEHS